MCKCAYGLSVTLGLGTGIRRHARHERRGCNVGSAASHELESGAELGSYHNGSWLRCDAPASLSAIIGIRMSGGTPVQVRHSEIECFPRSGPRPAGDHHSFAEHDAILSAIEERDQATAAVAMRAHLVMVQTKLLAAGNASTGQIR